MVPPIVLDIDGTLTRPDTSDGSIDPRVFDPLREWEAPVVIATGKAFPYPVALCHYIGIEPLVIAENGGIVCARETLTIHGDGEGARSVIAELETRGHDAGWGATDLANRWRETEVAVTLDAPGALLRELAAERDLKVLDTGYAYHVLSPSISKGRGLETVADVLDYQPTDFVAVGDSENDVSTFERAGTAYAVANADEKAHAAADHVTLGEAADGTLEVLETIRTMT